MKIKINTKKIKTLNPCQKFLYNWLSHYKNWSGDILEFLALPDEIVTYTDKLCVGLRVVPLDIVEYFAVDMLMDAAIHVSNATDAATAALYVAYAANYAVDTTAHVATGNAVYAAYAAAIATHYATYTAAHAAGAAYDAYYAAREKQRQKALDTLAYLIATH